MIELVTCMAPNSGGGARHPKIRFGDTDYAPPPIIT